MFYFIAHNNARSKVWSLDFNGIDLVKHRVRVKIEIIICLGL